LFGKQGLQDKVKLVAIELNDRPAWYKEKVYPENKVIALLNFSDLHDSGILIARSRLSFAHLLLL